MSQLFVSPFMDDVVEKRNEHKQVRNNRDADRVEGIHLLDNFVKLNILPDSLQTKAKELVISHSYNEDKSDQLYKELIALKKSKKVSGFSNLNIFLASIGNPIFILITGFLFIILFIFRRTIDWEKLVKSFLYLGLMYLFVAFVYLFWGFSPTPEIDVVYYIGGIILGSVFATIGLKHLLKYLFKVNSIKEEKLLKAIRILFKQLLHINLEKGYVKDEKFGEYIESNNDVIRKVTKEVKS